MDLFFLGLIAVGFALFFSLLWGCCARVQRRRLAAEQDAQVAAAAAATHDHLFVISRTEQPLVGSVNYYTQQTAQSVPPLYMGGTGGGVYSVRVAQPALPAAVLATNADATVASTSQFPAALPAQPNVAYASAGNNAASGGNDGGGQRATTPCERDADAVYGHATYLPRPPEPHKPAS